MLRDTVRLAQLNRKTKEVVVQKVTTEFAIRSKSLMSIRRMFLMQNFFSSARRDESEGGSVRKVHDRLSEHRNDADGKKDKSKRVLWVIWSSD